MIKCVEMSQNTNRTFLPGLVFFLAISLFSKISFHLVSIKLFPKLSKWSHDVKGAFWGI